MMSKVSVPDGKVKEVTIKSRSIPPNAQLAKKYII